MTLRLALSLAIALSVPVQAKPVTIGFAPPLDRDLAYHVDQQRPIAGQVARITADRILRFERAEGGYTLTVTLHAINTDAAGDAGESYRAALSPLLGVALHFHLNAAGRIIALENSGDIVRKVEARLNAMLVERAPDTARHRAATNVLTLLKAQSEEGRLALLSGEIQPLLLSASTSLDDATPHALHTSAGSPLARSVPVEGTVAVTAQDAMTLDLTEKLAGQNIQVNIDYRLSRSSGIVLNQRRTLEADARSLTEIRTLKGITN